MIRNPFYHRQGIVDPASFSGRHDIVRSLTEMISTGQSCAVIGERRIGKSSLLAYLAAPSTLAAHSLDPDSVRIIMLDFLALHTYSPEDLWREILDLLELADGAVSPRAEPVSFAELRRVLRTHMQRGLRVALLCDELELAVQNPQFDTAFFGALRSLASEGVVFVTASRMSLLELDQYRGDDARSKVLGSPFFNIFAEHVLGPFAPWEVAEMLATALDPTPLRFTDADIAFLDRIAGRHPYFLQLAAFHLFAALTGSGTDHEASHRIARAEIDREAAKIFRNQWQHSQAIERRILAALALVERHGTAGHTTLDSDALDNIAPRHLHRLMQRGLVLSQGRARPAARGSEALRPWRLFSEIFAEWLLDHVTTPLETVRSPKRSKPEPEPPPESHFGGDDRYTLLEELGRGGTGTVFKAWDERLERVVAIKVLDPALRASPERLERLLHEARLCAGLRHKHILTIHDIDVGRGWLIEELLAGGSLRDLLEHVPHLGEAEVVRLAGQLASALGAAHAAGVVHRDLKPENILLVTRPPMAVDGALTLPDVKLADFGTAMRLADELPHLERRAVVGTLAYMAPEQLNGQEVGPLADLYALGMVLHEAHFGHVARREDIRALGGTPFTELLARCLAEEPRDRFPDAVALRDAIADLQHHGRAAP